MANGAHKTGAVVRSGYRSSAAAATSPMPKCVFAMAFRRMHDSTVSSLGQLNKIQCSYSQRPFVLVVSHPTFQKRERESRNRVGNFEMVFHTDSIDCAHSTSLAAYSCYAIVGRGNRKRAKAALLNSNAAKNGWLASWLAGWLAVVVLFEGADREQEQHNANFTSQPTYSISRIRSI